MIRMQVSAPQWLQQTPQGISYAQPAGAAVFTNAIHPNPLEGGSMAGFDSWGGLGAMPTASTGDFILLLEKAGYPRLVTETVAEYLARAKARFQEDYGAVTIPAGKDEYWAYAQAYLDHLSAQTRTERHRKKYYEDAAYRKAVNDEHQRRIDSDPKYAKWVEDNTAIFGSALPPAPEEYMVAVESFVKQPVIYSTDDFYATQSKGIDPRYRTLFVPSKEALNNVPTQPTLPPGYVPMNTLPVGAQKFFVDMLKDPMVIGGIVAAGVGLWWLTSKGK